ncbi:hypothetical protein [Nonomuraea typhae]|uniref:hypothetical protein n=1 Tax=Nonomuraea typhae TaxID=2603600 RepID=UPI0012F78489|nr:hypothetical protein [Nonomuraea typhae]
MLKHKEPEAPIKVLPQLGVELRAPPGWLVVSTPADTPPYHWMRAQHLSTPGPCPRTAAHP